MSLVIKIKNADFSGSGLPLLEQTVQGFPADGLKGLYFFEEGENNTLHTGLFVDSSGNSNHGNLYLDFAPPINKNYGLEITDTNGLVIDTGIKLTPELTVIGCFENTMTKGVEPVYETHISDTLNIGIDHASGNPINTPRIAVNTRVNTNDFGDVGIYANNSSILDRTRSAEAGNSRMPSIYAVGVSGISGDLKARSLDGVNYNRSNADIVQAYKTDLPESNIAVGMWGQGSRKELSGKLYAFAIYDKLLTDEQFTKAITAMNQKMIERGITVYS
tara:strand:- start:5942 stop:6766 length:825 start_codon:yes stop_codon:yes gene_type:complete